MVKYPQPWIVSLFSHRMYWHNSEPTSTLLYFPMLSFALIAGIIMGLSSVAIAGQEVGQLIISALTLGCQ